MMMSRQECSDDEQVSTPDRPLARRLLSRAVIFCSQGSRSASVGSVPPPWSCLIRTFHHDGNDGMVHRMLDHRRARSPGASIDPSHAGPA